MWSARVAAVLGAAALLIISGWAMVAGQSTSFTTANYSACIDQTVARIICPGNQSMLYTAGDMATGAIPNCALRLWEPAIADSLNRTTVKLLHPNIVITNTTVIPLAARLTNWMQYPVGLDVIDSVKWTVEPYREFSERPGGIREAWFLDPVLTADMADEPLSALQDMSQLVLQDKNLNWTGYGTFFRRFAAVYDGKVVGLPVSAAIMLLYYRRDFFDANGIPVPATWEEVVDIAERYNGTDLDGTGKGAWGFCMSRQPRCYNGYTFQSIQVPFMQAEGTSQGFHFDPETMRPLVNSTGTRRAAELYRRLSRFTAPTEPVACLPVSLAFVSGNCLMAVGTTLHFKYATFNNSLNNVTRVRGKTGTTVLPGSFEVMNRTSGQMVRCTPAVCPYGRWHTLQNGTRAWVNAAPYAGRGAFTYALNRHREPHLQYMAYRLCARRVYADAMWPSVLSATAETTPVRSEMVDPTNVGRYTAAGYDRDDTLLFMKAVSDTMEHQNIALNLRIFGALEYYFAVDAASWNISDTDRDVDQILAEAQAEVLRLYGNVSTKWLRERYWKSIDRKLPAPPPPPPPPTSTGMNAKTRVGVGVGVGLGGGLLLLGLVALVAVVVLRPAFANARQRKAYVPVASPDCTLVVTDMEGSTNLWEAFPGDVMATALQMHDAIARKVIARHKGYESATEGDSFIVAFPNALSALRFALDFQAELMIADWPPVLLTDSDICRPVYAVPRAAAKDGQTLFRRSTNLRTAAASRAVAAPPINPAAADNFTHVSGVAAALSAAAGAAAGASTSSAITPAGRTRSGSLQPRALPPHHQQQQQQQQPPSWLQQQMQQLQEGQASQGGLAFQSLSEIPEQYGDNASIGSLGSLGGVGRLPSGIFRKPSGSGPMAAAQQRLLLSQLQTTSRASPLSAPPRAFAAAQLEGDNDGSSPLASSPAELAPDEDVAGLSMTRGSGVPHTALLQSSLARQQLPPMSKPSADDPRASEQLAALMTTDDERGSSAQVHTVMGAWSAMLTAGGVSNATLGAAAASGPAGFGAAPSGTAQLTTQQQGTASGAVALKGSGAGAGTGNDAWTYGGEAAAAWQVLEGPAPGAVPVYRGLRIRIGLFTGVRPHELTRTRASSRIMFCGLAIRMAKAVSDAANGGMVVLSDTSASQLLGSPEVAALLAGEGTEVWHLGRVKLAEDLRDVEMFQVVTPSLAPRLALQQPLRIKSQLLPGVLSAPAGGVALVRLHVSGLAMLRASEPELAAEVGGVLEALLLQSLPALGGYLSEARQGGVEGISVAFPDCLRAVAWALAVQADLMDWDWSAELLQHEAFETIAIDTFGSGIINPLLHGAAHALHGAEPVGGGGGGEITEAAAAAAVATKMPSRSRMYDSPAATTTGVVTPTAASLTSQAGRPSLVAASASKRILAAPSGGVGCAGGGGSFSSHTGRPPASGGSRIFAAASFSQAGRPPAAAAASGSRTGGGGAFGAASFSSQTGRQQASGGSRILSAFAGSFTASVLSGSQCFVLRGPVSRKLVVDVEGQAPSLLSPLQPPPELPVEAPTTHGPAGAEAGRKTPTRRITLPGFMKRGRPTQDEEGAEVGEEHGREGEEAEAQEDVESGRVDNDEAMAEAGPAAAAAAVGADARPSPARETLRLAAVLATAAPAPAVDANTTARPEGYARKLSPAACGTGVPPPTSAAGPVAEGVNGADVDDEVIACPFVEAGAAAVRLGADNDAGARTWYAVEEPGSQPATEAAAAAVPAPPAVASAVAAAAAEAAAATVAAAMARSELPLTSGGSGRDADHSFPPPPSSTATATGMHQPRGQVLLRGPRVKALVDFGGVSTEICRTTGRLLYRGRMAKQLAKLITAAKWGQVLATAAVYAQAGKAAPQVGISMAAVAGSGNHQAGGGGRRKPTASNSRTGPGAFGRPSSFVAGGASAGSAVGAAAAGGGSVVGGAAPPPASTTEPQDGGGAASAATTKKVTQQQQCYLCTLTQSRAGPVLPSRGEGKPPLPPGDVSLRSALRPKPVL